MSLWSKYLRDESQPVQWLMAACAATQGIYLAEKWNIEPWVALLICGVPLGLMSLGRSLANFPAILRPVGAAAHLLLAALTVEYLVRAERPVPAGLAAPLAGYEKLLILLLVVGAALAVWALVTRSGRSRSEPESPDPAGRNSPSNKPIE